MIQTLGDSRVHLGMFSLERTNQKNKAVGVNSAEEREQLCCFA